MGILGFVVKLFLLIVSIWSCLCSDLFSDVYHPALRGTILNTNGFSKIPKIKTKFFKRESRTGFTGHYNASLFTSRELHLNNQQVDDLQHYLSYETTSTKTGRRFVTYIDIEDDAPNNTERISTSPFTPWSIQYPPNKADKKRSMRKRRNVYGRDDRMFVPISTNIVNDEQFQYSVKISTGCTGILISPRHVLTAAHCIHDQKDYIKDVHKMRVGFLGFNKSIEWIDVKQVKISKGWVDGGEEAGPYFDYSLLRLSKRHSRPYIRLSISENGQHGVGERIYFTSFEDDKPDNTLWYRSCNIIEEDSHFLYHECDAKPGSSGSGVYSWSFDEDQNEWLREMVGVFSGNRWRMYDAYYMRARNFNVAVRLSSKKYAQICNWMGKVGSRVCHQLKQNRRKRSHGRNGNNYGVQYHPSSASFPNIPRNIFNKATKIKKIKQIFS